MGKGLPQHRDPDMGQSAMTSANAAPLVSQNKETLRQDITDSTAATRITRSLSSQNGTIGTRHVSFSLLLDFGSGSHTTLTGSIFTPVERSLFEE